MSRPPTAVPVPVGALRSAGAEVRPIPTVEGVAADVSRVARQHRYPILLKGLLTDWEGLAAWSFEGIETAVGDEPVTVLDDLPRAGVLFPRSQASYERTMPMSEFLRLVQDAEDPKVRYLAYTRLLDLASSGRLPIPPVVPSAHASGADVRSWIGSEGTRSMLHSDLKDNFFCQLAGSKSVTLLPWRDGSAAYPFPDNLVNSQIDLAAPDPVEHPRLLDVTFYQAVVEPGDVVFIPRGCWHDLRSLSASVSVNAWFGDPLRTVDYLQLLTRLGPLYWRRTLHDLAAAARGSNGGTQDQFFFSPPSTGQRLFGMLKGRSFSADNDPSQD